MYHISMFYARGGVVQAYGVMARPKSLCPDTDIERDHAQAVERVRLEADTSGDELDTGP